MMKASKVPASTQVECGVWLDTADLRRKKKTVRPPRPISKLLNPLLPSRDYSVSVAVSFTQTKLQFTATTQSSITSFLSPRLHGNTQSSISSSGSPHCYGNTQSSITSSGSSCLYGKEEVESAAVMGTPLSPPDATALAKKRKHLEGPGELACQRVGGGKSGLSPLPHANPGVGPTVGCTRRLEVRSFSQAASLQPEEEEPPNKRISAPDSTEFLPCRLTQGNHTLYHRSEGKENSWRPPLPPSPLSPKSTPWRKESRCLSPRKCPLLDLSASQVDSRSQLFTQDSEGRQVIAHRAPQYRTPLLDCRSHTTWREQPWDVPSLHLLKGELDSELSPELLFTQDSQGNRVIKHCATP